MGVSLFRINLSHTPLDEVERVIAFLKAYSNVPICLDSEGAQVRTGPARSAVRLADNAMVKLVAEATADDDPRLTLTPQQAVGQLRPGDLITLDFNGAAAQVVAVEQGEATARVICGGLVGPNKAVSVDRSIQLPALSPKDRAAIRLGVDMGVTTFALSFAGSADDVAEMRLLAGPKATVISKIESLSGLANLDAIALGSDAILIDRGDMSRQVPIERIPSVQKDIIRRAHALERPVYVATNLLESMITDPNPTRAEVNDIFNTLADGADGLVLAAETAIGKWPIQCVAMINRVVHEFEHRDTIGADGSYSALPEPVGGVLVNQTASVTSEELESLPALVLDDRELLDAEQIALGAFSPITGFMDKQTLESVLHELRTPAGAPWTMPILLRSPGRPEAFGPGDRVRLTAACGTTHAILDVTEVFELDLPEVCQAWYGTTADEHPGVRRLLHGGDRFVAGRVSLVRPINHLDPRFIMSPAQSRFMFERKGWNRVVGFHTRNVVHRAHEYVQLTALERSNADGLLLHPLIGPGKAGDFKPSAILASYQAALDAGVYPVLAGFASYPRYAGPREAVFTALVRRNFGCSHFAVGRDHSGVGQFYEPDAGRRLFDKIGDINIQPIFFDQVVWDDAAKTYSETREPHDDGAISGTEVRRALNEGRQLPDWLIRAEVQSLLRASLAAGNEIFVQ